jgi:hypothetical protein
MSAVDVHKAKITGQLSIALNALATLTETTNALEALLYAIPYTDELHPMHTDVTEAAYRALGDFSPGMLSNALSELKAEVA